LVAIKVLAAHLNTSDAARDRFTSEANAASAVDHPNISAVYEIDATPDGQTFHPSRAVADWALECPTAA